MAELFFAIRPALSACESSISAFAATLSVVRLAALNYVLAEQLIAQRPLPRRDASRMLLLDRLGGAYENSFFTELPALLDGDELLVCNNARVLPARLFGKRKGVFAQAPAKSLRREHLQGEVEVFLTR